MPFSTPIKEILDDDSGETIEVPCKKGFGLNNLNFNCFGQDSIMILVSCLIILHVDLESYSIASRPIDFIGEMPLQSLLIVLVFILIKMAYLNLM